VFDEHLRASIITFSRLDVGDIAPMLLSYTMEVHYRQVSGSSCRPLSYFRRSVSLWGFDGLIGVVVGLETCKTTRIRGAYAHFDLHLET
jgi:hypothetical protein